jgi:glycosyltransferase involved in cell wall biosynthesis
MPNYNKEPYIESSIRSALSQTFQDFELLFVDGSSTDASVSIAERLMKSDSRIRIIKHHPNRGVSAARNDGIRSTHANVISMLDSDDVYAPNYLERHLSLLQSYSSPQVVMSNAWKMNEQGDKTSEMYHNTYDGSGFILKDLLGRILYGGRMMLPKACLDKVGLFDETLPFGEDYDLALRLAKYYQFRYIHESLYGYRTYPGNTKFRIKRRQQCKYHAAIIEKHMNDNMADLGAAERRRVLLHLFHHLIGARDYKKLSRYGLTNYSGFRVLLGLSAGVASDKIQGEFRALRT